MSDSSTLDIQLEFGGGMELLFSSIPSRKLTLPSTYDPRILSTQPPPLKIVSTSTTTSESNTAQVIDSTSSMMEPERGGEVKRRTNLRYLIWYLRWKVLDDPSRPELFSIGESVPGILVLINSTDWELEGELDYVIEDGDQILFISTLHGG
ncbi:BZ3500_MvSof-1268-A1-R1_Chr6-1g08381 [Microbotryum saponariae]|uniref:Ubiquitin-related modifier 1 n=1 Tax=Microbotryum saponariae TaxID=289078 RepID=A0A2X0KKG8_9BASI|nr:BZ3500_MvSof-1268-A1-R1_Chr6-1g08381 [Microbotryum saponariae]SDA07665.1 BZ3501_MvSof-1269-A2-R1_Chr6-1g08102 [Microbotryum saponariae]